MKFHSADGRTAVAVVTRRPGRGIANIALLSILTLGVCTTVQHRDAREPNVFVKMTASMTTSFQRAVRGEAIEITDTRSDFDKEAELTPGQLIDRWNPLITAAAKQVGLPETCILPSGSMPPGKAARGRAVVRAESPDHLAGRRDGPHAAHARHL